jgi:uncharacterized protein (DUF1015 family)
VAVIKPFCSIRYNERLLAHAENLMTPPYDVISPNDQESYYDQNPFNVIRLILGKQFPDDTDRNNRYTRARDFLANWVRDGVLVKDDSASIYGYSQVYRDAAGHTKRRDGFVALHLLESWGKANVFPHEYTYSGPKVDRLNLVRATGHQLSTIFSLFSDPRRETDAMVDAIITSPVVTRYTDCEGVEHILTRCADEKAHRGLVEAMRDKKVFVADGHHRYETMLAFRDELDKQGASGDAHRYALMYFTLLEGESITILPCHRIVETRVAADEKAVMDRLSEVFTVDTFDRSEEATRRFIEALERKGKGSFGFYPGKDRYFLLSDADHGKIARFFPADMKEQIRRLDVSVLHHVLIQGLLGIENPKIAYSQDARDALNRAAGGAGAAFIVNATAIEEVKEASLVGERMPPKSTYFYPKTASGLVFYRMVT